MMESNILSITRHDRGSLHCTVDEAVKLTSDRLYIWMRGK